MKICLVTDPLYQIAQCLAHVSLYSDALTNSCMAYWKIHQKWELELWILGKAKCFTHQRIIINIYTECLKNTSLLPVLVVPNIFVLPCIYICIYINGLVVRLKTLYQWANKIILFKPCKFSFTNLQTMMRKFGWNTKPNYDKNLLWCKYRIL